MPRIKRKSQRERRRSYADEFKQEAVQMVYDGQNVALKFNGTTSPTVTRYLHGQAVDQVLAEEQSNNWGTANRTYWTLADHLGTVRDIANQAGVLKDHIAFDAFGKLTSETSTSINVPCGFTGFWYDRDTKLNFSETCVYDAATGTWMQQDFIGFDGGDANLMRYVGNLATNATDPTGKAWWNPYDTIWNEEWWGAPPMETGYTPPPDASGQEGPEDDRAWNEPPEDGWIGGNPTEGPTKKGDDTREFGEVIDDANAENANSEHKVLTPGDSCRLNHRILQAGIFLGELQIAACEFSAAVIEEAIWELASFGASKGFLVTATVVTHTAWYTRWFRVGQKTQSIVITVTDRSLHLSDEAATFVRTIDADTIRQYQKRFEDAGLTVPSVEDIAQAMRRNFEAANEAVAAGKKTSQRHHIATFYGDVGKRLRALFDSAKLDIEDCAGNVMDLPGHNGGHIKEYNQLVEEELLAAVEGLTGEKERAKALKAALEKLKLKLFLEPRLPYTNGPLRK